MNNNEDKNKIEEEGVVTDMSEEVKNGGEPIDEDGLWEKPEF